MTKTWSHRVPEKRGPQPLLHPLPQTGASGQPQSLHTGLGGEGRGSAVEPAQRGPWAWGGNSLPGPSYARQHCLCLAVRVPEQGPRAGSQGRVVCLSHASCPLCSTVHPVCVSTPTRLRCTWNSTSAGQVWAPPPVGRGVQGVPGWPQAGAQRVFDSGERTAVRGAGLATVILQTPHQPLDSPTAPGHVGCSTPRSTPPRPQPNRLGWRAGAGDSPRGHRCGAQSPAQGPAAPTTNKRSPTQNPCAFWPCCDSSRGVVFWTHELHVKACRPSPLLQTSGAPAAVFW